MIIIKILLLIILYTFLVLLGLLIVFLISPIKGRVSFDVRHFQFKGSYIFGLIKIYINDGQIRLRILGIKVYDKPLKNSKDENNINAEVIEEETLDETSEDTEKPKKTKQKKKYGIPSKKIVFMTLKLIKKLIRRIMARELYLRLKLGFDDPYLIGLIHMISKVLFYPLNQIDNYDLILEPVYDDVAIDYEGYGYVNFSIIQLIMPIIFFVLKKPIRNYLGLFKRKKTYKTAKATRG